MEEDLGKNKKDNQWYKPAMIFYAKVTSWIIFPLLVFLLIGRYIKNSTGNQVFFLLCLMISFGITCFGIYREIKIYQKSLDKK
jgi:hypothetical protein